MRERLLTLDVSWSKRSKTNPTESDLDNAIDKLSGEEYMILYQDQTEYMQAIPGSVEYRHVGRHFRCELDLSDKESIRRAMSTYLKRGDFRTGFVWHEITDELKSMNRRSTAIGVIAGTLVLTYFLWQVFGS